MAERSRSIKSSTITMRIFASGTSFEGQHVLIHGREHYGFFPTRNAAVEEGFRRFGLVPIFVERVVREENLATLTVVFG